MLNVSKARKQHIRIEYILREAAKNEARVGIVNGTAGNDTTICSFRASCDRGEARCDVIYL